MITLEEAVEALSYPHTLNYEKRREIAELLVHMAQRIDTQASNIEALQMMLRPEPLAKERVAIYPVVRFTNG